MSWLLFRNNQDYKNPIIKYKNYRLIQHQYYNNENPPFKKVFDCIQYTHTHTQN